MPEPGPDLAWLALLAEPRPGSVAVSAPDGGPAGHLVLAVRRGKPDRDAVRVAPEVIGPGPALAVSLVLSPRGSRPLFDDPAVVGAMRAVLRDPGRTALFSTLVDGSTRWAGSVSATVDPTWEWWCGDPFARLAAAHRLLVPAGVLRPVALPVGPCHQRHGGAPWPWGRF